mmetsp:Transcript_27063/g.39962  ORF Transcript_27063/g.39962 Transcript_27063/m.39962 type:complete len:498 (-) Transcript_27063:1062-2555(-)|eukprot:CAMPEP_0116014430 /NCGR_PEP_ID=MMETSP0321-20121206/6269_1 /TAXON_ID=163516 /ORGANISM="Leptocylindrus danicus var. danicus, Strain B650" /LENGTH=497 /DNA_ID=CAMNT_0003484073 /DNA_START=4114 /DNA_END=5607 /DNA_ORIENTATION=+
MREVSERNRCADVGSMGNASTGNAVERTQPLAPGSRRPDRGFVALMHSVAYTKILYKVMGKPNENFHDGLDCGLDDVDEGYSSGCVGGGVHNERDILLSSLLDCCGFLRVPCTIKVISPSLATRQHLELFHSKSYLDMLDPSKRRSLKCNGFSRHQEHVQNENSNARTSQTSKANDKRCSDPETRAGQELLWTYCRSVAGASLQAAQLLCSQTKSFEVAINWGGGRHHAKKGQAGGFCFVNDAVLAIKYLQKKRHRVLYIDIDIHHCDGVSEAFYNSDSVLVCSFHKLALGFYPCTGNPKEKGSGDGFGYNLNIPLPDHINDKCMFSIFQYSVKNLMKAHKPTAVVLAVGGDGLKGDPLVGPDGWFLSTDGLANCTQLVATEAKGRNAKLLLLGGGGYNDVNTARAFAVCTAASCCGIRPSMLSELPRDIPTHNLIERYKPDYQLHTDANIYERPFTAKEEKMMKDGMKNVDKLVAYISKKERSTYKPFDEVYNDNW